MVSSGTNAGRAQLVLIQNITVRRGHSKPSKRGGRDTPSKAHTLKHAVRRQVKTGRFSGFKHEGCSKRFTFSPAQPRRAKTRLLRARPQPSQNWRRDILHPPAPSCQSSFFPKGYVEDFDEPRTKLEAVFNIRLILRNLRFRIPLLRRNA